LAEFFLSIIIPAHNEEFRLPLALKQVASFLADQPYSSEVIVVENGSQDRTLQVGQKFAGQSPNYKIIHLEEKGKGIAIREGIFAAKGEFRFIADADFSMPVEEINHFLPPVCNSDITIASREASGSRRYNEPAFRHLIGRVFNLMIRLLVIQNLGDTQCGFKCFRAEAALDIFRYQHLKGWSFDVEVLKIAQLHGWSISEVPITWQYFPGSKVSILRDSIRMFADLIMIRRNVILGKYDRQV
jgi:dolichyl-phosphate beta-glucosyltransferase